MKTRSLKIGALSLISRDTLAPAGCWTPPNANVHPQGKPGLVQDGILAQADTKNKRNRPMKIKLLKLAARLLIPVALLAFTSCSSAPPSQATAPEALRNGVIIDGVTAIATVQSVDAKTRNVVLQRPDGQLIAYECGPDVVNFDQIRAGDHVTVQVADAVVIVLTKGGMPPSAGAATVMVRTPLGANPGGKLVDTVAFTAKVLKVDKLNREVTLRMVDGMAQTVKVGHGIRLSHLKPGNDVGVRLTRAFLIAVTPPEESPAASPPAAETPAPVAAAPAAPTLSPDEAAAIATEAYIFGYPLITMEYTRRVLTNVEKPEGKGAPMGQFLRLRSYPAPDDRQVTAPNADTLYTIAWLDVSKEPWVLSLPDAADRYYLMPMLDGWTDVFQSPGKRTTGTGPQKYAITGPNWSGTLPDGVAEFKSPTSLVWILGRIYCTGTPEDYDAIHKMQDDISAVPLSAYGQAYTPPPGVVDTNIDMKTPVRNQVNALNAQDYFQLLASLMKDNPPTAADATMVEKMAKLGIVPGQDFDINKFGPDVAKALQAVPKPAFEKIMAHYNHAGTLANGWIFTTQAGVYGTDYIQRATIAAIGLGCNRPQDAVYPTSLTDAAGHPYIGTNHYVMHFDAGQMPPAEAFWSLTMYNSSFFFAANPLNRYTLSSRNQFTANADGSVDLYLQHDSPGPDKESNWLPAPEGRFILMLRLYWPKETAPSIIDGTWTIPPVKLVPDVSSS